MKLKTPVAAAGLVVYAALVVMISRALHLRGPGLWIFNIALILIGAIVVAAVAWFVSTRKKSAGGDSAAPKSGTEPAAAADVDELIAEAERRVASATGQKPTRLASAPAVFIVGSQGAAKTSVLMNSGIDPELLAGQVYRDNLIAATPIGNLWLARGVVFVEFGGKLLSDPSKWRRLVSRLQPARLASVFGKGAQAPRSVVLCVDSEPFGSPGAADWAAAAARDLRARLADVCQILGAAVPVYVLFTRIDRVPFFLEFARNFTKVEAKEPFGVTFPIASTDAGTYAEKQTARIDTAFQQLFRSLSDARPDFLAREQDPATLPAIYEFPREFRKIRSAVVQFLVDLCKPSQLSVNPFLRGFYFTGVRPVIVNEGGLDFAAENVSHAPVAESPDATRIFRAGAGGGGGPAAQRAPLPGPRRVPQWMFLDRLFREVLLADTVAASASGPGTKVNVLRRAALASAIVIGLVLSIGFVVSFINNRALENQIRNAAAGVAGAQIPAGGIASEESLQKLEALRSALVKLTRFRSDGPGLSYRWGLYVGNDLYAPTRRLYFDRFHQLLLGPTQGNIIAYLQRLPATPGPAYKPTYDGLKAYLITTSNPEKSTSAFLAPALTGWWMGSTPVDGKRKQLASDQFDFYSGELLKGNMFSSAKDEDAVAKARRYLAQFGGLERVYNALLDDAGKTGPPINFNRLFPGSSDTVVESHEVPAAFGKSGFQAMTAAIADPSKYPSGEAWVLGTALSSEDRARLQSDISARYTKDFIDEWRAYMKGASVVRYKDVKDAAAKLGVLSSNQTPLLALFSLASQNTAAGDQRILDAFQPVHAVVPPAEGRYIAPSNQNYVNSLIALQVAVDAVTQPQAGDSAAPAALNASNAARTAARQLAQSFRIDSEGHVDAASQRLLEEPITNVETLLKSLGPGELNAKGKALCGEMRQLWAKYPFNPNATAQATVVDVNRLLKKPDGLLWTTYAASLQNVLVPQGGQYVPKPGAAIQPNPAFVRYFNDIAGLSEVLYAGNSQDPHFAYSLKLAPSENVSSATLTLDGQTNTFTASTPTPKRFTWQGSGQHGATGSVQFGNAELPFDDFAGLWGVFQFFGQAERWQQIDKGYVVEWFLYLGKSRTPRPGVKVPSVRFEVAMENNAPFLLQKGFFSRFGCVAEVAK